MKIKNTEAYPIKDPISINDRFTITDSVTGKTYSALIEGLMGDGSGVITAQSVVVDTVSGNKIAKHSDGLGTEVEIYETITGLSVNVATNVLTYTKEDGTTDEIDLSLYIDDTNLSRIVNGVLDGETGIVTFTRDDDTSFTIDFSSLIGSQPDLSELANVVSVNIGSWDMTTSTSKNVDVYSAISDRDLQNLLYINAIIFDDTTDLASGTTKALNLTNLEVQLTASFPTNTAVVDLNISTLRTGTTRDTSVNRGIITFVFLNQ